MKLKSLTIAQRIYALTGFLLAVIAGLSLFSILRIDRLRAVSESISGDSMPGVIAAANIRTGISNNQIRTNQLLRARTMEEVKAIRLEISEQSKSISSATDA